MLILNQAATNRLFQHEKSNHEEDLDRAALWQGRKEEEEGTVAEDVDFWNFQESKAEGQGCRSKDGEVYKRRTWSANTRPEEEEEVLGPVNSFHDNFALDELIQARTGVDEWSSVSKPPPRRRRVCKTRQAGSISVMLQRSTI